MKALIAVAAVVGGALFLSACENVTVQGVTERAIATKEIATATIDAICARPENDVLRQDIRTALAKISDVDSRSICTDGLDKYLTNVVSGRLQGEATVEVVAPVVETPAVETPAVEDDVAPVSEDDLVDG